MYPLLCKRCEGHENSNETYSMMDKGNKETYPNENLNWLGFQFILWAFNIRILEVGCIFS